MAKVFLSYDRADEARARPLALALEKAGHEVWWDQQIRGGAQFAQEIDRALKAADVIVVLWSRESVESAWVRDEAAVGRDRGRLVPATLDGSEPPLGFRQFQTIDLSAAGARRRSAAVRQLSLAIEALAKPARAVEPAAAAKPSSGRRKLPLRLAAAVAGLAVLVIAAVLSWRGMSPSGLVVAVRPADTSAASIAMARELFVRLGAVQSARAPTVQLVDANAPEKPDLLLEVSASTKSAGPAATLVLMRGRNRQLLASQDLAPPPGETADLQTSVAVAATSALECAAAAVDRKSKLPDPLVKQYLAACTPFEALYGMEDVSILIPKLEQVVVQKPDYGPAIKQLLLAGALMRSIPTDVAKPSAEWLKERITAARRVDPEMPEASIAEMELMPQTAFTARMAVVDRLRERHPDNKYVLGARAEQLMSVGRNNEAVVDAERTARLEPLSPYSRSEYARALAFSGRLSRAFEELREYRPISPVAMNLTDTRFRLNLRYGEPGPALQILRMYGTSKAHEAFLLAKVQPTEANRAAAIAIAQRVAEQQGFYSMLAEVLETLGTVDQTYAVLMRIPPSQLDQFTLQTLFRPVLKRFRQDPRFLHVTQRFGLLDYWRKSGKWPDFCSEPDIPYDCKKEAAKLAA